MLLALVTAQRTQTVSKLNTSCMKETTLKTTRHYIEIRSFTPDSRLCPVTCIRHFITKRHSLRSDPRFLISYRKPRSTVARWIRSFLQAAGIDVSIFSAHNSPTASTSYSANTQLPRSSGHIQGWGMVEHSNIR